MSWESPPKTIIERIEAALQTIVAGNTVSVHGDTYTFVNDLGSNIIEGIRIADVVAQELNETACSITGLHGLPTTSLESENYNPDILMPIQVEAAGRMLSRTFLSVAFDLLEDLKNAIDLAISQVNSTTLIPGAPGRPVWQIHERQPGSDWVIVARWYHIRYAERFPRSD